MKYKYLVILLLLPSFLFSQVSSDYAVLVSATYTPSPAQITLHWPLRANATSYKIYKKEKSIVNWGGFIAELPGDAVMYADNDVVVDSAYEYKIVRESSDGISAEGYLLGGIQLHLPDYRGKCLLVVDTTFTAGMENELIRLMKDISGDGWSVERMNVAQTDAVSDIRNRIIDKYTIDPEIQAVFLFGHVPVPYSGNLNPDGHPDHLGAWPADAIYGDMDGVYTDENIDNATASRTENWNVPGDGKYDQTVLKTKIELQVGRVDLSNLPSFPQTEEQLLKQYLDKDHNYRNGGIEINRRGLIDDNFGAFGGEAFASSGWRNFAPMFGEAAEFEADYFTTMYNESYLWSYGCGGGWYQGAGGVGSTTEFAADTTKTIFTLLFGSYFGDWDVTDNFLRAPLANGYTLTNAWSGRPYWHFHHMVLGENIGYSARLTQNNQSTYMSNICPHWVHIALMGDPTLRMHTVQPVQEVVCSISVDEPSVVGIEYMISPDPDVIGYYVYRSAEEFGKYERITEEMINYSPYVDASPVNGLNYYMIKAVKPENTPSGSYYNLSTGIRDSISIVLTGISESLPENQLHINPNPASGFVRISIDQPIDDADVRIYFADGKFITAFELKNKEFNLDVSAFAPGIYFIHCGGVTKKFIVE